VAVDAQVARRAGNRNVLVATWACIALLVILVIATAIPRPSVRGDSASVVRGSQVVLDCIDHAHFTNCDVLARRLDPVPNPKLVGPFPLLQYTIGIPLRQLGMNIESTVRGLITVNLFALVAILALAWGTLRRHTPKLWAPIGIVVLLASPLLWHARVAFGEELAAALILAVVAAAFGRTHPLVLGALVVAACITKETAPPFVAALAVICVLAGPAAEATVRRVQLKTIGIATVIGIALNAGFNIFRYGTFRNTNYTRDALSTTDPSIVSMQFVSQWFSPNGGLVFYWPLAPILVLTLAIVAFRKGEPGWRRLAVPALAVLMFGQMLSLAIWFSPFGWYSFGPRLILPFMPAIIVASCVLAAPVATDGLARFLRSIWLWPAAIATILVGLPQAIVLFHAQIVPEFFAQPLCTDAPIIGAAARYYKCQNATAWTKKPWFLQLAMHGLDSWRGWLAAIAFAGAVGGMALVARAAARATTPVAP
jgi:hypothetical protein